MFHPVNAYLDAYFDEVDRDQDGQISCQELDIVLGPSCEPDAKKVMEYYDWDGDGFLDEDQAR